MSFFEELKRRNVIRVGFSYAVVGWVIAQVADLALESFGTPDWVMKTLLFLMLIGFVVSLFIAWAYELTPEGIKRAEDVDPDQSMTHHTGRKLDRLFIVVLLLAVGTLVAERYLRDGSEQGSRSVSAEVALAPSVPVEKETDLATELEPSVAVLPFINMSSDPEQDYFSDGISEEILNVLTRIPNLKAAARTSSFQFKGKNLDIADIGKQLQVNHLLEGSVRKSGNTLRITAQLIETKTGFHLWSQTFDRHPQDVFAIQDEIAAVIAVKLRTFFSNEQYAPSKVINMQAYEHYLKGRGLVARRSPSEILEGINFLEKSLEIEPDYAPAMAMLAKAYVLLPYFSNLMSANAARIEARSWAQKALEIDAQNTEALAALAVVYNDTDMNPLGAIELLQRAIKLNPGSIAANNFLGDVYLRAGDLDNAMKFESRAAELDPLGPVHLTDLALVYLLKGDYDNTINLCNRALALDANFFHAYWYQNYVYYIQGNLEQSESVYQAMAALPGFMNTRFHVLSISLELVRGNRDQATELLKDIIKSGNQETLTDSVFIALAVQTGDFDIAGQLLLNALDRKDGRWTFPLWIRLPEQAPDSKPWQEFWRQPGPARFAALRLSNGLSPDFGYGALK